MSNYLPKQYKKDNALEINHNYLKDQFRDHHEIFLEFEKLLSDTQFTLGSYVDECELVPNMLSGLAVELMQFF